MKRKTGILLAIGVAAMFYQPGLVVADEPAAPATSQVAIADPQGSDVKDKPFVPLYVKKSLGEIQAKIAEGTEGKFTASGGCGFEIKADGSFKDLTTGQEYGPDGTPRPAVVVIDDSKATSTSTAATTANNGTGSPGAG